MQLELKKYKTVGVKHDGDYKVYNFLVEPSLPDLEIGMTVVCQHGEKGLSIGTIAEVHATPSRTANRFVIQVVDTATNDRLIALRNEGAKIVAELEIRVKELQRQKLIDDIVANDPVGAALLQKAKDLGVF